MIKNILTLTFLSILFSSCEKINIEYSAIVIQETDSLQNNTFLIDVNNIRIHDSKIYILERSQNQIFVLDEKFNHINTIGNEGTGPKDFNGITQMYISGDTLAVYSSNKQQFDLISITTFETINQIKIPSELIPIESDLRFFIKNNSLFSLHQKTKHQLRNIM